MQPNLTLSQIARTPSESVRPDLWPYYAWLAQANRGSRIFDLARRQADGQLYGSNITLDTSGVTVSTPDINSHVLITSETLSIPRSAFSIFSRINTQSTAGNTRTLCGRWIAAAGQRIFWLVPHYGAEMRFYVSGDGSSNANRLSSVSVPTSQWVTIAGVYNGTTGRLDVYLNGLLVNGTLNGTVPASVHENADIDFYWFRRGDASPDSLLAGSVSSMMVYGSALTDTDIRQLHNDPLLPFRRKTFVSFYVPTGEPPSGLKPFWARHCNNLIGVA